MDPERADLMEPIVSRLADEIGTTGFLVLESHEGKGAWRGMENWAHVYESYRGETRRVLEQDPRILPEDNATIIFTSGTYVVSSRSELSECAS